MKFASRLLALAALAFFIAAAPASAQYMFLDTDGDGVSTAADMLAENCAPTTVAVYLWTDRNRIGDPAECSTGEPLSINSYVVGLRVTGGTATFTNFINADPTNFGTTISVERRSDTEWQRGQGGGTPLDPTSVTGVPYKLMTITVTGATGSPALEIAPTVSIGPNRTSFGTQCPGTEGDNTYKLGIDWLDVDGAAASAVNNGKNMPVITAPTTVSGAENGPLVSVTATATDADADLVTLSQTRVSVPAASGAYLTGPTTDGPSLNPSITLSGTPTFTSSGATTITWTADDGQACVKTATTVVTIANTDRGPIVTAPASVSVNEGSNLNFTVSAIDPDVQTITTFTATGSAITAGATFTVNAGTAAAGRVGTLNWTPTTAQAGSYAVTFTASNALSDFAITTVIVNSTTADLPPVVTAPATASVNEGSPLTITITANDPDGPAISILTAAGTAITAGASFSPGAGNTSGTLTWTPNDTQAGTYAVTYTASNSLTGTASTSITVNDVAGDLPPVVTAPAAITGDEGSVLLINVTANDSDGDPITSLTAAGTAITAGATFSAGAGNTTGTLSWTPSFTQSGSYSVTFTATNALSGSASTAITIDQVDRAPTVTAPATVSVNESSLLTFSVSANDPDGDAITSLTATGTAITSGATFTAGAGNTSGTLTWTPTTTQSGFYDVTFTASNALSGSEQTTITVNDFAVDSAPVVSAPATASVTEGQTLTLNVTANDPDGDPITSFTAAGTAIAAGASFVAGVGNTSGTLNWTPTNTQSGIYTATFTATNALSGSAQTTITVVDAVDLAPTVTAPATASVNEGTLLTITITANDPDGDVITSLTATGSAITAAGATFVAGAGNTSGTFTWTPTSTQSGDYDVTFTAMNALSGSASTAITVNNVTGDLAPTVTAPATASVDEGQLLTINVTASDPDGDPITSLTATGSAITAGATFAAGTGNTSGTLNWTPTFTQSGSYSVTFTATNALSGSASTTITVNEVDRAPLVTAPPAVSGPENALITFTVSATDPDGDAITSLTASGTAITAGATFTAGAGNLIGTFNWTPTTGQSGSYGVTFTASNALSGSASTAVSVGVDAAPVVTAPSAVSVDEGELLTFTVSAVDADGDPITSLTAAGTAITAGATFTAGAGNTSGTFNWSPTFTQSGSYSVTFTASNALSGSASTAITVNNVDRAPTVSAPATASVNEGSLLTINVTANDPDGDAITSLTATGTAITAGATFAPGAGNTTGALTWTPASDDAGTYNVTFTASNALSGSTSTLITVIDVGGGNEPPVVTAPATASVNEGQLLTFGVSATDADGDNVTLSMSGGPAGASFADNGDNTGTFTWTPSFTQAGTFTVTFTGNDGNGGISSTSTVITVNNVNRPPTADAGGPYTGVVGVAVNFDGTGSTDPDGQALTFAWTFGDGGTGTGDSPTHTYATTGTFTVGLTVTDPDNESDSDQTTATIGDEFGATAFVAGGDKTIRLRSGKPFTCVQIEPVNGSFDISSIDQTSIVMLYSGGQISASSGKTSTGDDRNHNGVEELSACFAKDDLRTLFDDLPGGSSEVVVTIQANLTTGGQVEATVTLRVIAQGGALKAHAKPNPLNPDTEISFRLAQAGRVQIKIFDLSGRLVKTLLDETRSEGNQSVRWNGSNQNGGKVATGVYYLRIQANGVEDVQRVTVLK